MRSKHYSAACGEYFARLRKYCAPEFLVTREASGEDRSARQAETGAIHASLREDDFLVLCDETGQPMTSVQLAAFLAARERVGRARTVFLVGGPCGVDASVHGRSNMKLSLSALTLPHELAMVVLVEALYRAMSILRGEKYHRGGSRATADADG
jgi:23S rRNA (pseudouridine1915-N3)-methyltransferase